MNETCGATDIAKRDARAINISSMLTTIIGIGAAGLLLLFLEMFLPGLIAGILGGILLITAVTMTYTHHGNEAGNIALLVAAAASGAMWWWWAAKFQNTRLGRRMTLSASVGSQPGGSATLARFSGMSGRVITPLRPTGTILVAGKRIEATTEGEFLEIGTEVLIVKACDFSVVVRRAA